MKNYLEYKGYLGSTEVDTEGNTLVGKLLFIRDTVTYSSDSVPGLKAAFEEAVDDYLQTCAELGDEPDVPCKGTFNVRVGPELHREIALTARGEGVGLNDFVREALQVAVARPVRQIVEHLHTHEHTVHIRTEGETQPHITTSTSEVNWGQGQAYATQRH